MATSIYFMSVLVSRFDIVFDRGVCCVGHGKFIVDAINRTDKNTILKVTGHQVKEATADVEEVSTKMKVHTMKNSKAVSAADDCTNLLKKEYRTVQRRKRMKKEERTVEKQFWHLRESDAKLNMSKYATIKFDEEGTTFNDMHHFYICDAHHF